MLQSFIFGNSNDPTKPVSMEDLRRRQAVVDALAEKASDTSPVGHWSQGLNRVLLGVESGMKEGAIERDTRAAQDSLGKAFGALTGGGGATQPATMAAPSGPAPMPPDQIKAIIDATVPEADREYAYRMAQKESRFDPNIVSPTGATGLFQFTKGTGRDYGLVGQNGDMRSDPVLNTQAFVKFTENNRRGLRQVLGREPTYGELAVAHQQGGGGATALLTGQGSVDPRNLAVQAGNPKNAQDIMDYYGFGDGGGRAAVVGAMQGGPDPARVQAAMEVMGSDFATPGQKAVAQAIIEQSMRDPMEGELKRLQIEKARQDLHPRGPEFRTLSDDEERQMGLDPSKAYQMGRNGEIKAVGGGGIEINNAPKAEDKFYEELSKGQAKMFGDMVTEGVNATSEIGQIQQLRDLVAATPGGFEGGIKSMAASYGLLPEGEETTALQAAEALINKLVPAQRSPGSGPMSDRDVALYKSSLPSLWNSPGGNVILLDTMEALANYKAQQAEVAMAVSNRIMTPQEGVKSLMALPDPLAAFKEWKKTQGKGGGSPGTGGDLKSKYGLE